jgi:hypothetical protein
LQDFDDELVLYHFDKTQVIFLGETAALIWRLLDGHRSVGDIKRLLQGAYPGASDSVARDIDTALEQFVTCGAIEFV